MLEIELSEHEKYCAKTAFNIVKDNGGSISFDDYDRVAMRTAFFFPLHWGERRNAEKFAIFAAVKMGLVAQRDDKYETTHKEPGSNMCAFEVSEREKEKNILLGEK